MIDLGLVGLTELTGLFTRGPKLRHLLPMHCFLGNIYIISLVAIINKLMLLLCDFSLDNIYLQYFTLTKISYVELLGN